MWSVAWKAVTCRGGFFFFFVIIDLWLTSALKPELLRKSVNITLYSHLLCSSRGSYATPTFLSLLDDLIFSRTGGSVAKASRPAYFHLTTISWPWKQAKCSHFPLLLYSPWWTSLVSFKLCYPLVVYSNCTEAGDGTYPDFQNMKPKPSQTRL